MLATFTLHATAPLTVSGAVASINAASLPLSTAASASGTAALAEFRNAADAVIVSGLTVGVGTGDVQLNSTSITSRQGEAAIK